MSQNWGKQLLKAANKPEKLVAPARDGNRLQNSLLLQQFLDEFVEYLAELCAIDNYARQINSEELLASTDWNGLSDYWVEVGNHIHHAMESYDSRITTEEVNRNIRSRNVS